MRALARGRRLRGLPFSSSEQDVLAFFAQHDIVDRIAAGPKAVNLLVRTNGRPSGQAVVQMRDRGDAAIAQHLLDGKWMGSRYIEVFLHGEDGVEDLEAEVGLLRDMVGHTELAKRLALFAPPPAAGTAAEEVGQDTQIEQITVRRRKAASHSLHVPADDIYVTSQRGLNRALAFFLTEAIVFGVVATFERDSEMLEAVTRRAAGISLEARALACTRACWRGSCAKLASERVARPWELDRCVGTGSGGRRGGRLASRAGGLRGNRARWGSPPTLGGPLLPGAAEPPPAMDSAWGALFESLGGPPSAAAHACAPLSPGARLPESAAGAVAGPEAA
ncbi:unnamed protein product [Prorocentrum cordatum]|uniref:RRM domain-containing protein n=1 Tax=Prorocentrum cordatum TaxID=2364126 RepID=A0ABN9UBQ9_9DINO|nr:unnamed protein product [Polarella glacialis]